MNTQGVNQAGRGYCCWLISFHEEADKIDGDGDQTHNNNDQ